MNPQQTLSDEMKKLLTVEHKLEALASLWLERWSTVIAEAGRTQWSQETVLSSISSLKNGNQRGVKFFGPDPRRLTVLMDILRTPEEARIRIVEACQQCLAGESGPKAAALPRVIVDLSSIASTPSDELVDALIERLVNNQTHETTFVVTDDFYQRMRLSISAQALQLTFKRAPDAEQCLSATQQLAGESGALVVSVTKYDPVTRWLGAKWEARNFT